MVKFLTKEARKEYIKDIFGIHSWDIEANPEAWNPRKSKSMKWRWMHRNNEVIEDFGITFKQKNALLREITQGKIKKTFERRDPKDKDWTNYKFEGLSPALNKEIRVNAHKIRYGMFWTDTHTPHSDWEIDKISLLKRRMNKNRRR